MRDTPLNTYGADTCCEQVGPNKSPVEQSKLEELYRLKDKLKSKLGEVQIAIDEIERNPDVMRVIKLIKQAGIY